jgi:hypothetical protein
MCFIVQQVVHIPFIYYIGKENFLIMYDEYMSFNLSNMVNRVRSEQGDPRYFLAELKNNSRDNINKGGAQKVVFLHRMPHMKLKPKTLWYINLVMYTITMMLTLAFNWTLLPFQIISTALTPFD